MKQKLMSYNEAKAFLKPLGLKNKQEYDEWWNANKPDFLPQFPEEYYGAEVGEETEKPSTRTIDDVLKEIREIIDTTHWEQTRLTKLKATGFKVEECWVTNGRIETMIFMKQKKVLRIQVTESEQHGDFYKANFVIIAVSDIEFQEGDSNRVRHLPDFK